jgi:multidrug efflux pump subunit AcrA (membrane-fusion protein)
MRSTFLIVLATGALATLGCSKSETAQARGRDATAKPVTPEVVRLEKVKRAVELVGTLAAVDQVTISSEADGKVSRILADLGDRVTAGQTFDPDRSRKAAIHARPAEGDARARARAARRV